MKPYLLPLAALAAMFLNAAERPNILLIVSEDNGPELGCYGDPFVRTPVLDKLAASGVRFQNAYVPQADPHEFRNLAEDPKHVEALHRLRKELLAWRKETNDPLLRPGSITRLKDEIDACFINGKPDKTRLNLTYPEYFFSPMN